LQAQRLADERRITEPKLQADRRSGRDALTALTISASAKLSAGAALSVCAAARASCCARALSAPPPQPDASATAREKSTG